MRFLLWLRMYQEILPEQTIALLLKKPEHLDLKYRLSVLVPHTGLENETLCSGLNQELAKPPMRFNLKQSKRSLVQPIDPMTDTVQKWANVIGSTAAVDYGLVGHRIKHDIGETFFVKVIDVASKAVAFTEDVYLTTTSEKSHMMAGLASKIENRYPLVGGATT